MAGIVDHDRSKSVVDAVLADVKIRAVVQMKNHRNLRMQLGSSLNQLHKINAVGILSGALGSLQNDRALQLCRCISDSLDNFHVVNVESADGVSAGICFLEQFSTSYNRHNEYHLSVEY